MTDQIPIKRALVSVYDKAGLDDLVRGLHDAGVELVSTGGSAALIESLHERIKVAERGLLVDTVGAMARHGFTIDDRKVRLG